MTFLIQATFTAGFYGKHGIGSRRHAFEYATPRDLPLVIDWGFLQAALSGYDIHAGPIGYYKADGETVAVVVCDG